jgi:hypothetical protein
MVFTQKVFRSAIGSVIFHGSEFWIVGSVKNIKKHASFASVCGTVSRTGKEVLAGKFARLVIVLVDHDPQPTLSLRLICS